ncbi:hypothetical protein ACRAWG_09100 [Methylobacterium sp. P31]
MAHQASAFIPSYAEAEWTLTARYSGGTFNGLVREFTSSVAFETKLSAGTPREYKRMLAEAEPEFGDMSREAFNDWKVCEDLMQWRAQVARTPRACARPTTAGPSSRRC